MKHWTIGLLTALLFGAGGVSAQQPSFRADDPKIDYVGRVAFAEDGSASFDWSGTTVRFRFSGNACAAHMSDTKKSYYLVSVDGRPYGETVVWGCDSLVLLADGLQPGPHTLSLFKRTEAGEGLTTLHSIEFPSGGGLLPWFGTSERRIEFIGNSITCGFGSETADPGAEYRAETENAYHSYASIVARFFGADYTLIAHSGQGVVRNYGDTATESDYTMIQRFGKTFDSRETPDWDFSRWQPDVVVIGLGTNDFSVGTPPSRETFIAGYRRLVAAVRKAYGDIPILCLSSPLANDDLLHDCVREAVRTSGDARLYFVPILPSILDFRSDVGAGHPNYSGHRKIAMALIPYLSSATGWPCLSEEVR